jgi:uncharacterized membrane protein
MVELRPGQWTAEPVGKLAWLGVAYPLLAHVAIATGSPALTLAAVGLLVLLMLGPGLVRGRIVAWILAVVAAVAMGLLYRAGAESLPLYAPPVLVTAAMAWLFGHTLLPGSRPLIERLVRLLHAPDEHLDPAIASYARKLTLVWTLLFVALSLLNLVLALCATPGGLLLSAGIEPPLRVPREVWSAFANLLNYVIIGTFFVAEYAFRRRVFPQQQYRNFFDFTVRAMKVGPQLFGRPARAPQEPR